MQVEKLTLLVANLSGYIRQKSLLTTITGQTIMFYILND